MIYMYWTYNGKLGEEGLSVNLGISVIDIDIQLVFGGSFSETLPLVFGGSFSETLPGSGQWYFLAS